MIDVKKLEKLEKKQEEKVRLRKGWTEKVKKNGNSKRIEKAQAEEDKAIAVLEKIREDKQIFKYVYHLLKVKKWKSLNCKEKKKMHGTLMFTTQTHPLSIINCEAFLIKLFNLFKI